MRILLSSVGRRGYLVKYFQEAVGPDGQVWGGDSCPYSPAFTYCDKSIVLPNVDGSGYVEKLLGICNDNEIDMIIPLIDPELEILAGRYGDFEKAGVMVVVSPIQTIELTYDKYKLFEMCRQHGIAAAESFLSVDQALKALNSGRVRWPLVVKPRKGSASASISYCSNEKQLKGAFEEGEGFMIQEKLNGQEYGYDIFGNEDCLPVRVFCKKKLVMRAGETDKAVSCCSRELIDFGYKFAATMKIFGPIDADVIVDKDGPKLLEINPRFGGGYPLAHLCGMNFTQLLVDIRYGKKITADDSEYPEGVYMLKQDEIIRYTSEQIQSFKNNS